MVGASDAHGHVSSLENRGGVDKRGGAHSRYQFFRSGKIGGGGINEGGVL